MVDEEHDGSYKQQDKLRYHARDLALVRAREAACPVVLGSATPSLESLANVAAGRYVELPLEERAGGASAPAIRLLDIRRRPLIEGLSDRLIDAIGETLSQGGQAMVFINRRGFAPTLICNDCGQPADCRRCDAHMTVHAGQSRLRCHHCGSERPLPPACEHCGSVELDRVGYGTERIAAALEHAFPDVPMARIDRDSTRRKGELDRQLARAASGEARILVGTQMLAKGHHFPALTLVGILDADRGLFGTDFRALEHMAQLVLQVAGRAGRAERPGTVLLQTRNPDHPLLNLLVRDGYRALAEALLEDRRAAELPPASHLAVIRAEAASASAASAYLAAVREQLLAIDQGLDPTRDGECLVLGPAAAPMERLGGRYRAQLLLQASRRAWLHERLARLVPSMGELPGARKARWSIDVDPVDLG
ncbi:MAG: primosomal protein N' [Gammaproteobacteria bacterium]|nr:MAG: primosomal protein N' [Gammaproteobacteria bacterium]